MKRLFAGLAFLTRLPVPGAATFGAADVGRATLLFPLVGALLGGLLVLLRHALHPALLKAAGIGAAARRGAGVLVSLTGSRAGAARGPEINP